MTSYHRQKGLRYPSSYVASCKALQTAITSCCSPTDQDSVPVAHAKLQVATACVAALDEHFPSTGTPAPHVAWNAGLPAQGPAVEDGHLHPEVPDHLLVTLSSVDTICATFPLLRGIYSPKVPIEIYLGRVWASVKHAFSPFNWDGAQLTAGSHYFLRTLFPSAVYQQLSERRDWSVLCRQIIDHLHPSVLEPSAEYEITNFFCEWYAAPPRTFFEAIHGLRSDIEYSPVPIPGFALLRAAQKLATDYELDFWYVNVLWPAAKEIYADGEASLDTNAAFVELLSKSLASVPPDTVHEVRPSRRKAKNASNTGRKTQRQSNQKVQFKPSTHPYRAKTLARNRNPNVDNMYPVSEHTYTSHTAPAEHTVPPPPPPAAEKPASDPAPAKREPSQREHNYQPEPAQPTSQPTSSTQPPKKKVKLEDLN